MSDSQVAKPPVVPELDSLDAALVDASLLLVVPPSTLPLSVLVELVAEVVIVELALLVSLVLPDDVSTLVVTVVVGLVAPVVASSSPPHAASAITYAKPRGIRCKRVFVMRAVSIAEQDCVKATGTSVRTASSPRAAATSSAAGDTSGGAHVPEHARCLYEVYPSADVNPWFDGVEYGQANALTWRDVVSNDCP